VGLQNIGSWHLWELGAAALSSRTSSCVFMCLGMGGAAMHGCLTQPLTAACRFGGIASVRVLIDEQSGKCNGE
jgi:hypothetical protein